MIWLTCGASAGVQLPSCLQAHGMHVFSASNCSMVWVDAAAALDVLTCMSAGAGHTVSQDLGLWARLGPGCVCSAVPWPARNQKGPGDAAAVERQPGPHEDQHDGWLSAGASRASAVTMPHLVQQSQACSSLSPARSDPLTTPQVSDVHTPALRTLGLGSARRGTAAQARHIYY